MTYRHSLLDTIECALITTEGKKPLPKRAKPLDDELDIVPDAAQPATIMEKVRFALRGMGRERTGLSTDEVATRARVSQQQAAHALSELTRRGLVVIVRRVGNTFFWRGVE